MMRELNAVKERHEVDQETEGRVLLVRRYDNLKRVFFDRKRLWGIPTVPTFLN